jgi:hypothetical protein
MLVLLWSCTSDPMPNANGTVPKVTTQAASNITYTSVSVSISIDSQNANEIGVLYSTNSSPNKSNSNKVFTSYYNSDVVTLTGLNYGTKYYYRGYATNQIDTVYGDIKNFTTATATAPIISSTTTPSSITQTSAYCGGSITSDGGFSIIAKGVCWSTTINPTTSNSKTSNGSGSSSFSSSITGLSLGTTYYVRAYATNSIGTSYGNQVNFTTNPATLPIVSSTTTASSITQNTAVSGGTISGDGGGTVTSRGVCWSSTTSTPTIANSKTIDGTGIGTYSSSLTGLTASTTYYYRAYATNSAGTSYGTTRSFLTNSITIPTISSTTSATSITQTTAVSGGTISIDGGSVVTSRGICWSSSTTSPTTSLSTKTVDGSGIGTFTSTLSGLTASTTYYVRAYATNSIGTVYGSYKSFTTSALTTPTLSATTSATSITTNSAICGGNITNDGGVAITARGVCWSSTTTSPTISLSTKTSDGTGSGSFSSSITGLTSRTTYYVRSYATNSRGTTYGAVISFITN